jgi:hypothetical protein
MLLLFGTLPFNTTGGESFNLDVVSLETLPRLAEKAYTPARSRIGTYHQIIYGINRGIIAHSPIALGIPQESCTVSDL